MSGVVGLDLSLASTGFSDGFTASTIRPMKRTGLQRLRFIRDQIATQVDIVEPNLVCVEGPSYGSKGGHEHERGGLWWIVRESLDALGYHVAVVSPSSLKKYATGKGNASKDQMIVAACKRFPWFDGGNDEADALFLAALGLQHLGKPVVEMPAVNLTAMTGVDWPEMVAA
jgi:crossover junction endodeoxyribonuclease RuvC